MKPKAPEWLRLAFRDGVDWQMSGSDYILRRLRPGETVACWLAHRDERRRPCAGPLERAHLIPRQRIENAMWEALREAVIEEPCPTCEGSGGVTVSYQRQKVACFACDGYQTFRAPLVKAEVDYLILLAAWDPRNGVLVCQHHHRRWDNHATPRLIVLAEALPSHFCKFVRDYGLEHLLPDRFSGVEVIGPATDPTIVT